MTEPNIIGTKLEAEVRDAKGRFAVGGAGGPGRKPGKPVTPDLLRKIGQEIGEYKGQSMTKIEALMRQVFDAAQDGKPWAIQWIVDRTDGKAIQRQEIEATVEARRDDPETAIRQARAMLAELEPPPSV